jgi:hypothetical protein
MQIATDGTGIRTITQGITGLRDTNDYPTAKTLEDGSYLLFTRGYVKYDKQPSHVLMVKLPPMTAGDSVDRSKFVDLPITLTPPPGLGIARAVLSFGYLENGNPLDFYCTSRAEACIANSSSASPTDGITDPFKYVTSDMPWSGVACATTCTITVPVLPMHVVYYQAKYLNADNQLVIIGERGVSAEAAAVNELGVSSSPHRPGRPRGK